MKEVDTMDVVRERVDGLEGFVVWKGGTLEIQKTLVRERDEAPSRALSKMAERDSTFPRYHEVLAVLSHIVKPKEEMKYQLIDTFVKLFKIFDQS